MLQTELLIGAAGWEHENWVGNFYPQDLPDDWRFGYYANRLRSVLVPSELWQSTEIEAYVNILLEDVYPEFRMVLEWVLPDNQDAPALAQVFLRASQSLDEHIAAYLVHVSASASDSAFDAIKLLQAHHPVCLICDDPPAENGFSGLDGVGLCWLTDSQVQPVAQGQFLVALATSTDPRRIREIIEKINTWPEGLPNVQGAALFFVNEKAADTAFQARTIAELMGV